MDFHQLVMQKFAFLSDYGFTQSSYGDCFVEFSNRSMTVTVDKEYYSYELDVWFKVNDKTFGISALMSVTDPEKSEKYRAPMASTQRNVEFGVNLLAELTVEYCLPALRGDASFLETACQNHKIRLEKYWKQFHSSE